MLECDLQEHCFSSRRERRCRRDESGLGSAHAERDTKASRSEWALGPGLTPLVPHTLFTTGQSMPVRPLRFAHPAGQLNLLGQIFSQGPLPGRGDSSTIVQAYIYPGDRTADAAFTPCLRMVIDVGSWQNARWDLPDGQSGNPASPHYDGQLQRFQLVEGIPIPWTPGDVEASTWHTLHLRTVPRSPASAPAATAT